MSTFTSSQHCRRQVHCRACRSDPVWRESVGAPNECPYGMTVDDLALMVDLAAVVTERLTVCNACGQADCSIKHQSSCRRRAILGRENFRCPEGRF